MELLSNLVADLFQSLHAPSLFNSDRLAGFLTGFVLAGLLFATLGRAAYNLMRPVRALFRPVVRLLRRARILPRAAAGTRPLRGAVMGAQAAARKAPPRYTETEWALIQPVTTMQPDAETAEEGDVDNEPKLYDFREENRLLKRIGLLFKSMEIDPALTPDELKKSKFAGSILDWYAEKAKVFFGGAVQLDVNERALYEDAEGAVFINLFRDTDRRAYYALDRMRRTINGNASTLVVSLWLALFAPVLLVVPLLQAASAKSPISEISFSLVVVAVMAFFAIVMSLMQNLMYANQQRQNMKTFNKFLTEYLGFLSDRFRETSAEATRAIQGDKRDAISLEQIAQKWLKVLVWLPFRAFFLESFVRGVKYQIRRNAEYYLWFGYVLAACAVFCIFAITEPIGETAKIAIRAAFVGFAGVYIYLIRKKVILVEINTTGWRGFDNLDVGQQMDEVIGTYAAEIAKWNGRFDRGAPKD